jgi:Skp family chaperone for outer membrane proteins
MTLRMLFALLLLAIAMPAAADLRKAEELAVSNMTVKEFLEWHAEVARRAGTQEFEALTKDQRASLAAAQSELRDILEGRATMAELDVDAKLRVFNAHERVLALITQAEDDRLVCEQKKRLGSHRHQLVCRTARQLREDRDNTQNELRRTRTCNPGLSPCG